MLEMKYILRRSSSYFVNCKGTPGTAGTDADEEQGSSEEAFGDVSMILVVR